MSAFVPPSFEIVVSPAAPPRDGVVMAVAGELDVATAPEFEGALREQLSVAPVRLDLRGLSFMASSGIRVLDAIIRDVAAHRWTLVIEPNVQPAVGQILALTGMTDALPFDTPREGEPTP